MTRIIGSNVHGNTNETNLVEALNNKKIIDLGNNLKEFINFICINNNIEYLPNLIIKSRWEKNNKLKQDLYLTIDNNTFSISLKMGSGNSVHQEKCEDFIKYIKEEFDATEEICNDFRFFIWADNTFDGSGDLKQNADGIISRFTLSEFKKRYPQRKIRLQNFLTLNEKELVKHFLLEGRHNSKVDFIYHGTPLNGAWINSDKVISYNLNNSRINNPKDSSALKVGRMTLQAWNISKKGTSEKKRGQLQVKYTLMKSDFKNLMLQSANNIGTFFGDIEEFDISRTLNKNKNHKMWNTFNLEFEDNSDLYIVKVDTRVKSKLSNKLVNAKSDAYMIAAEIPDKYLLSNEYILTEKDIKNFDYQIIDETGISVKRRNSKKFTIQKLTRASFYKIFTDYLGDKVKLIFSGLLIYSDPNQMNKNNRILKDLEIDNNDFIEFYSFYLKENFYNLSDKSTLDSIRKMAQTITKNIIVQNESLAESIFLGKYWFDDPHYATYIFKDGSLEINDIIAFYITTGSGRSKGSYSIEIKPL